MLKERILRLCARGKLANDLRVREYLQANPGESEVSAWLRLRSKLGDTGRHLDEVLLMKPSAVPTTGGTTQPVADAASGSLWNTGSTPVASEPQPSNWPTPTPTPVVIFDTKRDDAKPLIPLSNPPTSPLNLIGKIEEWGIGPATPVTAVAIKISAGQNTHITGAQLKELLKKLPDGMTFELSLEKESD